MSFPLPVLQLFFTANEVARGSTYFKAGRVDNVKVFHDQFGAEISSTVEGSDYSPYRQNIFVFHEPDADSWEDFSIEGDCSCPVGFNCKHVAAVLFSIENQFSLNEKTNGSQSTGDSFDTWLEQTADSFSTPPQPDNATNYVLVFELHVSTFNRAKNRLSINLVKARKLKSGALSQAQSSQIQVFNVHGGEKYLAVGDVDIIHALQVCARKQVSSIGFLYNGVRVSGRIGAIALEQLLVTNRFYLGDYRDGKLLTQDETRVGEFKWIVSESGNQSLSLTADSAIEYAFDVTPLMGLSIEQCRIFSVNTGFDSDQVFQLLEAPEMSPEASLEITPSQRKTLELSSIPEPAKIRLLDIKGKTVQPILKLGIATGADGVPWEGIYAMGIFFRYNEMEPVSISANQQFISQLKNGVLERCARDFEYEQQSADFLATEYGVAELSSIYPDHIPAPGQAGLQSIVNWYEFLDDGVSQLEAKGWSVVFEDDFNLVFDEVDQWHADIEYGEDNGWFDLALGIEIAGNKIQLLPILLENFKGQRFSDSLNALQDNLDGKQPISIGQGQHILLPNKRLIPLLETFVELFDQGTVLSEGKLKLTASQEVRLTSMTEQKWAWRGGAQIENFHNKLKKFSGIESVKIPQEFTGTLRDYQQQGVNWLQFMGEFQLGGILADDMGLGKTVQALAHLCVEKHRGRLGQPSLIVAPTSLMSNWRNETASFAPTLSILVLHGAERERYFGEIEKYDIVLTSYALVVRDAELLTAHNYHYLILDESQKIKNHKTKAAGVLQLIRSAHRLCLTGTPMENHLGELWSQFNFLMPGFLGDEKYFNHHYRKPIEKNQDHHRRAALQKRISPVLLRRTKDAVASELPAKTEIIQRIELSGAQRDLYETIRLMMDKKVRREIASKGVARSQIMILDALLKLRQVCCHPGLLKLSAAKGVTESAKLELLLGMLPELVEEGRKILLFSQFTSMLSVIESELEKLKIDFVKLTGKTKDRETPITQFQTSEVPVFLISLKAGGTGLNLTSADTVIHYDPWWNPAVEDQATDRAHRIGQTKPVFVYKLVTESTVEAKILAMQKRKRLLAEQALKNPTQATSAVTEDDLQQLFAPLGI